MDSGAAEAVRPCRKEETWGVCRRGRLSEASQWSDVACGAEPSLKVRFRGTSRLESSCAIELGGFAASQEESVELWLTSYGKT